MNLALHNFACFSRFELDLHLDLPIGQSLRLHWVVAPRVEATRGRVTVGAAAELLVGRGGVGEEGALVGFKHSAAFLKFLCVLEVGLELVVEVHDLLHFRLVFAS